MRHKAIAESVKKKVRKALNILGERRGQGSCDPHPSD
jgi:hypothetical protein